MGRKAFSAAAAAVLSASMLMNAGAQAPEAEEPYGWTLYITVEQEDMAPVSGTILAEKDSEGNWSLAMERALPAETGFEGETGSENKTGAEGLYDSEGADLSELSVQQLAVFEQEGTLWLNAGAVSSLYTDISGDFSAASLAALLGIGDGWVKVPDLQPVLSEGYDRILPDPLPELSESFRTDLSLVTEVFPVNRTEETVSYAFDKSTLAAAAEQLESVLRNHEAELWEIVDAFDLPSLPDRVDWKETFADYIDAAAKGRSDVLQESEEASREEICSVLDKVKERIKTELTAALTEHRTVPDFSAHLESGLDAILHGQLDLPAEEDGQTGTVFAMDITKGEAVLDFRFELSAEGKLTGVIHFRNALRSLSCEVEGEPVYEAAETISAPETGTDVSVVFRNIAALYFGLQSMGDNLTQDQ